MKYSIALLTLAFALNASAGCPTQAPSEMPAIPDGASASEAAMQNAMSEVQTYVQTIEDMLDCRGILLSASHYDRLLDNAQTTADAFNTQLALYRQRNGTLAQN